MVEKQQKFFRNICIGLVDGLTIPLAIAAGLSRLVTSNTPVIIACLIASAAGSVTMSVGGYFESRKYAPGENSVAAAFVIGAGYLIGGVIVAGPYFTSHIPAEAFEHTAAHTLIILFLAGYWESRLNGGKGWSNALRVCITAAIVAAAAFFISKIFRG